MVLEQMRCLKEDVLPALASEGIVVAPYESLSKAERDQADEYFAREVFPVLTPLAVDPAHPFPYISGLSLNFGIIVRSTDTEGTPTRFIRLKVPPSLPGLVQVGGTTRFAFLRE